MSRTLTVAAQQSVNQRIGAEPVPIVKVQWGSTVGTKYYAGKEATIGTAYVSPQLLELRDLEFQRRVDYLGSVSTFEVTIDDSDGDIRSALDVASLEGIKVDVLLHFEGNAEADLLTLVRGAATSPVEWSEGQRQVTFTVESKVSDAQVGTVIEAYTDTSINIQDGQSFVQTFNVLSGFRAVDPDSLGRMWPLCYGRPVHVPALRVQKAPATELAAPFRYGDAQFDVVDATGFLQGQATDVAVGGVVFRGSFNGRTFTVTEYNRPSYQAVPLGNRATGDVDEFNPNVIWLASYRSLVNNYIWINFFGYAFFARVVQQQGLKLWLSHPVDNGSGIYQLLDSSSVVAQVSKYGVQGWALPLPKEADGHEYLYSAGVLAALKFAFNAGTTVQEWDSIDEVWICNGKPSTSIKAVYGKMGGKMVGVPSGLYTAAASSTFGGVACSKVTMKYPLSSIGYDGDQIYVTLNAGIEDAVLAIQDLFNRFSPDLVPDAASFAAVSLLTSPYKVAFALLDRKDVLQVCQDIAWQARCSLLADAGTVKVSYLSQAPGVDLVLDDSGVLVDSLVFAHTDNEEVVTRFVARWRETGTSEYGELVYEANQATYGLREQTYDFFIYDESQYVNASASFWANRYANVWRLLRLTTTLPAVKLEVNDDVQFSFADASLLAETGQVHRSNVNLVSGLVSLELWLPVVSGATSRQASAYTVPSTTTLTPLFNFITEFDYAVQGPDAVSLANQRRKYDVNAFTVVLKTYLGNKYLPQLGRSAEAWAVDVYGDGFSYPPTERNRIIYMPAAEQLATDPVPTAPTVGAVNDVTTVVRHEDGDREQPLASRTDAHDFGGSTYYPIGVAQEPVALTVLATISSEVGSGVYNWTRFVGPGPQSGQATELNGSTGIIAGTNVVLHRIGATWYFFFPVEDCN